MKMDVALFLLAFALFWKSSHCVQCYKCNPERGAYDTQLSCQSFDGSGKFVVECESSTMCYKRVTTLSIGNELTTTVERGCAAQTINGDQKKIRGKWVQVHDIYEVYEESCREKTSDYQRPTKTTDCYCRGDLCNTASVNAVKYLTLIPALATVILLR